MLAELNNQARKAMTSKKPTYKKVGVEMKQKERTINSIKLNMKTQ